MFVIHIIHILLAVLIIVAVWIVIINQLRIRKIRRRVDTKDLEDILTQIGKSFSEENADAAVVIGIIKEGQHSVFCFGKTSENKAPDKTTIFEVPALAKIFTAACIQIFSDREEVLLEEDIRNCIPETVTLPQRVQGTTLLQLATHTSGFPFIPEELKIKIENKSQPYCKIEKRHIWNYLKSCTGKNHPGIYKSSDYGMSLLSCILERIRKLTYEEMVQEEICRPLQMLHTSTQSKDITITGRGPYGEKEKYWNCGAMFGSSAIYSNIQDLLAFLQANLSSSNNPLNMSLKHMLTLYANGYSGLGWQTAQEYERIFGLKELFWIAGRTAGFSSYMALEPTRKLGIAVVTDVGLSATSLGVQSMYALSHISFRDQDAYLISRSQTDN